MSIETFIAAIYPYQPPLMFCAGLLTSIICCLAALIIQSTAHQRQLESVDVSTGHLTYQRFREQLNRAPRHVEFACDEIDELNDGDFVSA